MNNKNVFFGNLLQILIVVLLLMIYFSKSSHIPSTTVKTTSSGSVLFLDSRGDIVDPYQRRQVKNTVTANARSLQICFNQMVDKGGLKDKSSMNLNLDWTVNTEGRAKDVRVIFSEVSNDEFLDCIQDAIESWNFPKPSENTYTEHRFSFSKASSESAKKD